MGKTKFNPGDYIILNKNPKVQLLIVAVGSHKYTLHMAFLDKLIHLHTLDIFVIENNFRLMTHTDKVLYGK